MPWVIHRHQKTLPSLHRRNRVGNEACRGEGGGRAKKNRARGDTDPIRDFYGRLQAAADRLSPFSMPRSLSDSSIRVRRSSKLLKSVYVCSEVFERTRPNSFRAIF